MLVGYARVSATHQNLDRQLALLKAEGCNRVFREKLSGRECFARSALRNGIVGTYRFSSHRIRLSATLISSDVAIGI